MARSNSEDEYPDYTYVAYSFRKNPTQSSQKILNNFKAEESKYGSILKSLAEMSKLEQMNNFYLDPDELLGRIDLIDRYHRHSFLPSVLSIDNPYDLVEVFFEHKWLFYLYEDTMRRDPILVWLKLEVKQLEAFYKDKKSIITHKLEEYIRVLEQLKSATNLNPIRYDVAKQMLVDICTRGHCNNKRDFTVAELVFTEIRYLRSIEDWLKLMEENVFVTSRKFYAIAEKIYGKLPVIYEEQKKFLLSLQDHLYEFDIVEIMDCFLKHENTFNLYIEDRRVKRTSVLEDCKKEYPAIRNLPDITLDRIFKYSIFMEKFHKVYKDNKIAQKKIRDVNQLFDRIIGGANNILAIIEIIEPNINIHEQGTFLYRETMKVSSNAVALADVNKKDCMIFLFEKCLVFTKQIPENKYFYIYHILTSGISYRKDNQNDIIISRGKMRDETFKLVVKDDKLSKLAEFEKAIKSILDQQMNKIRKSLNT